MMKFADVRSALEPAQKLSFECSPIQAYMEMRGAAGRERLWESKLTMEMHQVRYFLAVARTLNFTRAAEQCNVSQPALTRAIRQLEEELAGTLLRREGKHSHLTDLGERMVPLMRQCYES